MRVFCPTCSEPINIADDLAGKTTNCPLCGAAFTAPALFSAAAPTPSSPGVAPANPVAPPPTPTGEAAPPPTPAGPKLEEIVPSIRQPTPGPAAGYARSVGFSISPEIIQWTAPVCLGIVVLLTLFFSWNGAYPGGHGVYTQGAFKALFGSINIDPDGERVLKLNPLKPAEGERRLVDEVHSNWLMLLILPLIFAAFALAVAAALWPRLSVRVPSNVQSLVPWRMAVVAGLCLILILLLAIQAWRGFGLENAIISKAQDEVARLKPLPDYPSETHFKEREILEGTMVGAYNVRQTTALRLVFLLLAVALVGAALTQLMTRRTDRPAPRFEFMW